MTKCAMCGGEMKEIATIESLYPADCKDDDDQIGEDEMRIDKHIPGVKVCTSCRNIHAPRWNCIDSEED